MTDARKIAADDIKLCPDCHYSDDLHCLRESRSSDVPYRKSYERQYTDSDFCGPNAQFYRKRSLLRSAHRAVRTILQGQGE